MYCTANFFVGGPTLGCAGKYGEEKWAEYLEQVPYGIVPGGVSRGLAAEPTGASVVSLPSWRPVHAAAVEDGLN